MRLIASVSLRPAWSNPKWTDLMNGLLPEGEHVNPRSDSSE